MRKSDWAWIGLAVVIAVASCLDTGFAQTSRERGSFEKELKVSGPVELDVTTGSGNITITPGDPYTVKVVARISARGGWGYSAKEKIEILTKNPPIEQSGNSIRIGYIEDKDLARNVAIDFEIIAPPETKLSSGSGSGDQKVNGLKGPAEVSTGSGNVTVRDIGSELRVETGSGDIDVASVNGSLHASTGSGNISAKDIRGAFEATTGSGDVTASLAAPGAVRISSGSGNITLDGVNGGLSVGTGSGDIAVEGTPAAAWEIETSSGNVHTSMPENIAFELYARSSNGSIETSHPITLTGAMNRRELRGKIRGGGPSVDIETGSGDIRLY